MSVGAQLVKPQLLSVLPSLAEHLKSDNYVCYTYAAISIERILFIRQGNRPMYVSRASRECGRKRSRVALGLRRRTSRAPRLRSSTPC